VRIGHEGFARLVDELCADPSVTLIKMMGRPALKAGTRMFCGLVDGELLLRLGRDRVDELIAAERGTQFDPMGRGAFRDWALVPEPVDDWLELALEALDGVRG
jgi:hypothetical protein